MKPGKEALNKETRALSRFYYVYMLTDVATGTHFYTGVTEEKFFPKKTGAPCWSANRISAQKTIFPRMNWPKRLLLLKT